MPLWQFPQCFVLQELPIDADVSASNDPIIAIFMFQCGLEFK